MKSNDKFIEEFSSLFKRMQKEDESRSPLHVAVTCFDKNTDEVKEAMIAAFKSGVDINDLNEEGNTPLMCLLNEAQKSGKKYKNDFIRRVKFLIERGASLGWSEEECEEESNKIYHLIKQVITSKNEIDEIYRAQQNFQKEAKKRLSEYIESDVEEVSIYGSCAKIQLKDDTNEFKISEFLQSDFCKNNGISGFSTLHGNGKSGMHGVVFEGIRRYVVTDGSYEMTLNWPANGINHTIKIRINADGTVKVGKEYLDQYKAGEIDVDANKNVKLGDLFLAEALAKGRWKENEVQNSVSETIRSSSQSVGKGVQETVRGNSATHHTPKIVESQHVMASIDTHFPPIIPVGREQEQYEVQQRPGNHQHEVQQQEKNNHPFAPSQEDLGRHEDPPIIEDVIDEDKWDPLSPLIIVEQKQGESENHQQPKGQQASITKPEVSLPNSNQGRSKTPPPTPLRVSSLIPQSNSMSGPSGNSNGSTNTFTQGNLQHVRRHEDPPIIEDVIEEMPKIPHKYESTEALSLLNTNTENVTHEGHKQPEGHQRSEQKGDDHSPNRSRSGSESDSGYSSPTTNEFEPQINSQEAQEKRDHRQAAREENSRDQVYNLQSIFADQHMTSKGVGYTMNGQSKKNVGQSDLTLFQKFLKEIRDRSKQDNKGLRQIDPKGRYISPQTKARLIKDGLLKKTQAGVKTVAESEISNVQNSDKAQQEWDPTHDFPLYTESTDSGFEEELEALGALSEELEAEKKNKVIHSTTNAEKSYSLKFDRKLLNVNKDYFNISSLLGENEQIDSETVKLNNAQSNPDDQVMSELKEALKKPNTNKGLKPTPQVSEKNIPLVNAHDPFSDCIEDKRSNLHKLLEEDKAQSKIGVLEGEREDGLTKPTINCDRNKVALATQCIELSTKIQQLWVEQATVLSRENDKLP